MEAEQQKRLFCKTPVGGSPIFNKACFNKATKITMFEKFCLWFINPKYQVDEIENNTLKYKIFRGKMYVLNYWINPPKHWNCRHSIVNR